MHVTAISSILSVIFLAAVSDALLPPEKAYATESTGTGKPEISDPVTAVTMYDDEEAIGTDTGSLPPIPQGWKPAVLQPVPKMLVPPLGPPSTHFAPAPAPSTSGSAQPAHVPVTPSANASNPTTTPTATVPATPSASAETQAAEIPSSAHAAISADGVAMAIKLLMIASFAMLA